MQSEFSKKYVINLEKKMPIILEALVSVYGEEYRDIIYERAKNIHFLFTGSDGQLSDQVEAIGTDNAFERKKTFLGSYLHSLFVTFNPISQIKFIRGQIRGAKFRAQAKKRLKPYKDRELILKRRTNAFEKRQRFAYFISNKIQDLAKNIYGFEFSKLKAEKIAYILQSTEYDQGEVDYIIQKEFNRNGVEFSYQNKGGKSLTKLFGVLNKMKLPTQTWDNSVPLPTLTVSLIEQDSKDYLEQFRGKIPQYKLNELNQYLNLDEHHSGCVFSVAGQDKSDLHNFVVLSIDKSWLNDNIIVHEIIHALDTSIQNWTSKSFIDGQFYPVVCSGFKDFTQTDCSSEISTDANTYNTLHYWNEMCTQYKTLKVLNELKKRRIKIVNNSFFDSVYNSGVAVLEPLLEMLEQEIIDLPLNRNDYPEHLEYSSVLEQQRAHLMGLYLEHLTNIDINERLAHINELSKQKVQNFEDLYTNINKFKSLRTESNLVNDVVGLIEFRNAIMKQLRRKNPEYAQREK